MAPLRNANPHCMMCILQAATCADYIDSANPLQVSSSTSSQAPKICDPFDSSSNHGFHPGTRTDPVSDKSFARRLLWSWALTITPYRCPLLEPRFSKLKQSIIAPEKKQKVIDSYKRVVQACHEEAKLISKMGPSAVPEIDFEDIVQNGESNLPSSAGHVLRIQAVQCRKASSISSATAAA